ncbi:hypothetical protein ABNN70_15405 [Sporolactobacillus sp. Y61]|uniref:Uncharacterized protein n=1 Tax=Sporolactobacillus sp. Y61 TaxID=3160863 RepID=A0AAU8IG29_9BACL
MESITDRLDLRSDGIWYPIAVAILLVLIVLFMRKREMNWRYIYFTFGIVGTMTWVIDMIVGVFFHGYILGWDHVIGLGDLFGVTLIPSFLAIIFLNYRTPSNKWLMLILFILLSLLIEGGAMATGYFRQRNWNLFYSVLGYVVVFGWLLPLHKRIMNAG